MSRVYEALRQIEKDQGKPVASPFPQSVELLTSTTPVVTALDAATSVDAEVSPDSRLVALSDPKGLGAEKFRSLAARLENLRNQKPMKSLQITSAVINEGKTLISINLALTLAKHSHSRVLLLEGDLHRPTVSELLKLRNLRGLSQWWSGGEQEIQHFLYRLNDLPLWLLSAGGSHEQPSQILQSKRFSEAFTQLSGWFDWIIVDSTPMLPVVDVNLWSRCVDGTLLVVREGTAPVGELKKGIASIDNLKLLGVVLNGTTDSVGSGYGYYGGYLTDRKAV